MTKSASFSSVKYQVPIKPTLLFSFVELKFEFFLPPIRYPIFVLNDKPRFGFHIIKKMLVKIIAFRNCATE